MLIIICASAMTAGLHAQAIDPTAVSAGETALAELNATRAANATNAAGTPGLDETAPVPVDDADLIDIEPTPVPPVTVNLEIDPGESPDFGTEKFSTIEVLIFVAIVLVAHRLGMTPREVVRSTAGKTILTGIANYRDVIPGQIDDALLSAALRMGRLKLVKRLDGYWDVVPKEDTSAG
jgi:hypothetical protein